MRLESMLASLSGVPLWHSLLNGAPLSVLVFVAIYLRPVALKWLECRAKSRDIRAQCDCQVEIERIRATPQTSARVLALPRNEERGSERRRPPHRRKKPKPDRDLSRDRASDCPSWDRTRTLLIQSQACCQLHQGASKSAGR
jgi:hypothetical protein